MNKLNKTKRVMVIKMKAAKVINNRGGALLLSFFVTMLLAYAASSLVQVRGSDIAQSTDHIQKSQSSYVAVAAIEFAKYRVDRGLDPDAFSKSFGAGNFDIVKNLNQKNITVIGRVGKAQTKQTVDLDYSAACFSFEPQYDINFGPEGGGIYNLGFKKTCHEKVIIDKVNITWNGASSFQKFVSIKYESGSFVYNATVTPVVGSPASGATSGVDMDINDLTIADSSAHQFLEIYMKYPSPNWTPPRPLTFYVTFIFKDGSSISKDLSW